MPNLLVQLTVEVVPATLAPMRVNKWSNSGIFVTVCFSVITWAFSSAAATDANLVGQNGVSALAVKVDLGASVIRYRVCPSASAGCTIDGTSSTLPITLDGTLLPDPKDVRLEVVAIGSAKHAVVVHIPAKDRPLAFDAILVERPENTVVYSGITGYVHGQTGSMTGERVDVIEGQDGAFFVVVGDIREDNRICGQDATLLSPRVLDAKTLTLRGASVQQLSLAQQSDAEHVVATALTTIDEPLAHLLTPSGASSGSPRMLVDGDRTTTWSETRSGVGRGEFVTFASPSEVPIARLAFVISPPNPPKTGAAPKTFFVVAHNKTLAVTMPDDAWLHPGVAYELSLSTPLKTDCLSIVLDDAYAAAHAKPEVTLTEIMAYSDLESKGATLDTIALALSGGGARANAASGLLKRSGDRGAHAVMAVFDKLDPAGRALSIDVAAGSSCDVSAPLFVKALVDKDAEVAKKAEGKIERCGKTAAPALIEAVRSTDFHSRSRAAGLLALVAPSLAVDVLAQVTGQGPNDTRAAVRQAFAVAARSASAQKLSALLDEPTRTVDEKLDMLRAVEPRLAEIAMSASRALSAMLAGSPDFRIRYLTLSPLGTLARAHDPAAISLFSNLLAHDGEGSIRAHAAELAPGIPEAQGLLVALVSDPEPRVRDAAVRSIASLHLVPTVVALGKLLDKDPWTFVRVDAATALASMPASPDLDATLGKSVNDPSALVRAAAVTGLAAHGARAFAVTIRLRLDDVDEAIEVRTAAARALGSMCDAKSFDRLTELTKMATSSVATEDEVALAVAAIEALGEAHPADLPGRIGRLDVKGVQPPVRAVVKHALSTRGTCAK